MCPGVRLPFPGSGKWDRVEIEGGYFHGQRLELWPRELHRRRMCSSSPVHHAGWAALLGVGDLTPASALLCSA